MSKPAIHVTRSIGALEEAQRRETAEECAELVMVLTLLRAEMVADLAQLDEALALAQSKVLKLSIKSETEKRQAVLFDEDL